MVIPQAVLKYDFENGRPEDSAGTYSGSLKDKASIVTLDDGNKTLYTGAAGGEGYMDLGAEVGAVIGALLTGDYSFSLDMKFDDATMFNSYCWPFTFCRDNGEYIALINAGDSRGWYFEAKNSSAQQNVSSYIKFTSDPTSWHNVCYSQSGATGTIYVDGESCGSGVISIDPSVFAALLTCNYFGKSPYADPIFTGMYLDNFRLFTEKLSNDQVELINSMKGTNDSLKVTNGLTYETPEAKRSDATIYDLSGRYVSPDSDYSLRRGIYIRGGRKYVSF